MRKKTAAALAWLMVAAMLISLLPRTVRAESTILFEQLSEEEALTDGQYVLLGAGGFAAGCLKDGWLIPVEPEFTDGILTAAPEGVWTLEVSEEGILLTDPAGVVLGPGESEETGLAEAGYRWQVRRENGCVSFHAVVGETPVTLCWGGDQGFRAYNDRLVGVMFDGSFVLYRLTEQPEDSTDPTDPSEEPTEPTDPSEDPTDPTDPSEDPTEEPTDPTDPPEDPTDPTDPSEEPEVPEGPGLFFGQLHSHTGDSDGMGTPAEAYAYADNTAGLDFLAITDHSNSFDGAEDGVLNQDGFLVSETWRLGKEAAKEATTGNFLALYGYEMTWQNGLGHISTFFTPGFQSRKQDAYANYATALDAYYQTLAAVPGSVSQFNHPGTFYGEFENFAHYSSQADQAMALLEVVCEGVESYEAYTRALDLGWHVAPTNNQNNHNGQWGSTDGGRTVVYAQALTEEAFAQALAERRVYATEDSDLEIFFDLDGFPLGSRLTGRNVGETVTITASVTDPTDASAGLVEVIVSGGAVAASRNLEGSSGTVQVTLPSSYPYYYLRITQPDGDVAVTAPVWIHQNGEMRIRSFTTNTLLAVQGESVSVRLEVENRDTEPMTVECITFRMGEEILGTLVPGEPVPGNSTAEYTAELICGVAGAARIRAEVTANIQGEPMSDEAELTLTFLTEDLVTTIVADGSHGPLPTLSELEAVAAAHRMKLVKTDVLTAGILSECDILLIPAPEREYDEDYVNLVREYAVSGRMLILCGRSDETGPDTADWLNSLLDQLDLTARFRDDTAMDPVNNGGRVDQLYTAVYSEEIRPTRPYCQMGGCSLDPGEGTWLVKGMATTFSVDADEDGKGIFPETYTQVVDGFDVVRHLVTAEGEAVLLVREENVWGGTVYISGGMFLGDDALDPGGTNPWDEPNGNAYLLDIILDVPEGTPMEVLSLAEAGKAELGATLRVRGYVTAGTAVEGNRFPNMIYIQDDTGGLGVLDFTTSGVSLGTPLEVYLMRQEDGFHLLHWEVREVTPQMVLPRELGCSDASDYGRYGQQLVKTEGKVVSVTLTEDGIGVSGFTLEDRDGTLARVQIESCITSGSTGENTLAEFVKEGNWVSAVGIVYHTGRETVLRVRNCDEVVLILETGKTYRVIEGAYTVWIPKEGKSIYMVVEGPAEEFLGIEVDGVMIHQGSYQTTRGQYLNFRFWPRYLHTLSSGSHRVVYRFRSGDAVASILVWNEGDNPDTGDAIGTSAAWMVLSGGVLVLFRRKKRQR